MGRQRCRSRGAGADPGQGEAPRRERSRPWRWRPWQGHAKHCRPREHELVTNLAVKSTNCGVCSRVRPPGALIEGATPAGTDASAGRQRAGGSRREQTAAAAAAAAAHLQQRRLPPCSTAPAPEEWSPCLLRRGQSCKRVGRGGCKGTNAACRGFRWPLGSALQRHWRPPIACSSVQGRQPQSALRPTAPARPACLCSAPCRVQLV